MEDVNILNQYRNVKISTSTIADILDSKGIDSTLPYELSRLAGNQEYVAGYAYTVEWGLVKKKDNITQKQESTWDQVRGFIDIPIDSGKNTIYVAGSGELMRHAALAGGISTNFFQKKDFEAMILGGAIRDYEQLQEVNIPVVASNWSPADTQGFYKVKSVGESCRIGQILINTGDLIVSDMTGTVCIPKNLSEDVLLRSLEVIKTEDQIFQNIREGLSPVDIIESKGRI
jgi:regulator of RNase E activity RraA